MISLAPLLQPPFQVGVGQASQTRNFGNSLGIRAMAGNAGGDIRVRKPLIVSIKCFQSANDRRLRHHAIGPNAEGVAEIPRLGGLAYTYLKRRLQQWGEGYHANSASTDASHCRQIVSRSNRGVGVVSKLRQVIQRGQRYGGENPILNRPQTKA